MRRHQPDYSALVGERIGGYIIQEFIGAGGQAAVYKAYSQDMGQDAVFALKIFGLINDSSTDLEVGLDEAKKQAKVDHPSVVNFSNPDMDSIDFEGEKKRALFIPMTFSPLGSCDGGSLFGERALARADYDALISLLDGLHKIHKERMVHNDIKPANILRFERNIAGENRTELRITDFGMSKVLDAIGVKPGHRSGMTPQFMAPERIEHGGSSKTDVYSMGATLYYMMTGEFPIKEDGSSNGDVLTRWANAHGTQARPYADEIAMQCPPRLALLMVRMMSIKPEDRPTLGECVAEIKKTKEIEHGRKFEFRLPPKVDKALDRKDFPISYVPSFRGFFWPNVHRACGNNLYIVRMKMPHPVFEQYKRLVRFVARFYLDCFNLYETWGTYDVNLFIWSPQARFEAFIKELRYDFPRAEPGCAVAGHIHHFHQAEQDGSVKPAEAIAAQEGVDLPGVDKSHYLVGNMATDRRRRNIRAFTYVEAASDGGEEGWRRGGIINHVRELSLDLQRNNDQLTRITMIELSNLSFDENRAFQNTPVLVDFQASNYSQLPVVPTRVISLGAHTVRTVTCLETRRVAFRSGKILL